MIGFSREQWSPAYLGGESHSVVLPDVGEELADVGVVELPPDSLQVGRDEGRGGEEQEE